MLEVFKEISFIPLEQTDIEMVRRWRNNKEINKNFINQKTITVSEQIQWFQGLKEAKAHYFIATYKGEKIGLFYCTNVNLESMICEPNGFVGEAKYLNTFVAGMVFIAFIRKLFNELGFLKLKGKVLSSNESFVRIHEQIGATLDRESHSDLVLMEISKNDFKF